MGTYYQNICQTHRICNIERETMKFGWLWCINVGLSVVTNVPLW